MTIHEAYAKGFDAGRRLEKRKQIIRKITFPAFMNVDTTTAEINRVFKELDEVENEQE